MVSKNVYVDLINQVADTYTNWNAALCALSMENSEDKITHLVDSVLDFAAAAIEDTGLPARHDTLGRLNSIGHDMPLTHFWCWELEFGTKSAKIVVNNRTFFLTTPAQLYDCIEYINSLE